MGPDVLSDHSRPGGSDVLSVDGLGTDVLSDNDFENGVSAADGSGTHMLLSDGYTDGQQISCRLPSDRSWKDMLVYGMILQRQTMQWWTPFPGDVNLERL